MKILVKCQKKKSLSIIDSSESEESETKKEINSKDDVESLISYNDTFLNEKDISNTPLGHKSKDKTLNPTKSPQIKRDNINQNTISTQDKLESMLFSDPMEEVKEKSINSIQKIEKNLSPIRNTKSIKEKSSIPKKYPFLERNSLNNNDKDPITIDDDDIIVTSNKRNRKSPVLKKKTLIKLDIIGNPQSLTSNNPTRKRRSSNKMIDPRKKIKK